MTRSRQQQVRRDSELRAKKLEDLKWISLNGRDLRKCQVVNTSLAKTILHLDSYVNRQIQPPFPYLYFPNALPPSSAEERAALQRLLSFEIVGMRLRLQNYRSMLEEVIEPLLYDEWERLQGTTMAMHEYQHLTRPSSDVIQAFAATQINVRGEEINCNVFWDFFEEGPIPGTLTPKLKAIMLFQVVRFRRNVNRLMQEQSDPHTRYRIIDLTEMDNHMEAVRALKPRGEEDSRDHVIVVAFQHLCRNVSIALAAAANFGYDQINTLKDLPLDCIRITTPNEESSSDGHAPGLITLSQFMSPIVGTADISITKDEAKLRIWRFAFEQPECTICMEKSRHPIFCTSDKCGHWVCRACMTMTRDDTLEAVRAARLVEGVTNIRRYTTMDMFNTFAGTMDMLSLHAGDIASVSIKSETGNTVPLDAVFVLECPSCRRCQRMAGAGWGFYDRVRWGKITTAHFQTRHGMTFSAAFEIDRLP